MGLSTCVVMATYQGATFIEQQFKSFFLQTVLPKNVVVRDDCSTDDTLRVLEGIMRRAPFPITIIRGVRKLGYRDNFIEALRSADADIYFFSDQDDVWYAEKIEMHLDVYDADPDALVVISDQDIVGPNLEPSGRTSLAEILKRRGGNSEFVHGCCTSFRKPLYGLASNPAEGFAHDDWVHAIALACRARRVIETPLQAFRRHDNTTTSSSFNSFHAQATSFRSISDARHVAANLRRRQAGAHAIADALRQDDTLPSHNRRCGIEVCDADARRYSDRAARLEQGGASGMWSTMTAAACGKQSIQQGLADIFRIATDL